VSLGAAVAGDGDVGVPGALSAVPPVATGAAGSVLNPLGRHEASLTGTDVQGNGVRALSVSGSCAAL
jgi:hypothetical protein